MGCLAFWVIGNPSVFKSNLNDELSKRLTEHGYKVLLIKGENSTVSDVSISGDHGNESTENLNALVQICEILTQNDTCVVFSVSSVTQDAMALANRELENLTVVHVPAESQIFLDSIDVGTPAMDGTAVPISVLSNEENKHAKTQHFDITSLGTSIADGNIKNEVDLILSAALAKMHGVNGTAANDLIEHEKIEVSILMPCLNEVDAIADCVTEAKQTLEKCNISGEVIVVDNGSTDGSPKVALAAGARVFHEPRRGYGSAYIRAIREARGEYLIMGDSDGTYDFTLIPEFIELLKAGNQFVNGSRVKGKMDAGAIPFLHRYLGVPLLTWTLNLLSGAKFSDAHCGMRGFTREAAMRMGLNSSGMEFASEMILQATRSELRTAEIPIPYRLRKGESKLRTFADGWRHIRFMLLHCPTPLFVVPGAALSIVGMIVMLALVGGRLDIGSFSFDIHYMVVGSILSILGFQIVSLGISARLYALSIGILKRDDLISWGLRFLKLERGLMIGSIVAGAGFGILFGILVQWLVWGFNNSGGMMGASILGMTLFVIGIQIIFGSFFNSLLSMRFPRDGNSNN